MRAVQPAPFPVTRCEAPTAIDEDGALRPSFAAADIPNNQTLAPAALNFGYDFGEILLPPGSRADVVAAIPPGATGTLTLWTSDFSRAGQGFANIPTVPVMHLNVTGAAAATYTIVSGTNLRAATGDPVPTLGAPAASLLNPAVFAPVKLGSSGQDVQLTQNAHHPFHLHGFSIQPVSLTRPANPTYTWPYSEFRDNVDIPPRHTLTFRIRLEDRALPDGTSAGGAAGRWVFHCHIFFHATKVAVTEPATASMTGTFKDPENGAVTLSASFGTVTAGPGGTWSWSRGPTSAGDPRFVYITATDPANAKGQTAFLQSRVTQPEQARAPARAPGLLRDA